MKISLIGYGKMGQAIEPLARYRGHEIVRKFNRTHPLIHAADLADVDVCIDFSAPDLVVRHAEIVAAAQKPLIIGTTGWNARREDIARIAAANGCLYSPNFSIGMNLFQAIVTAAAQYCSDFPQYDPALLEIHHSQKADSPSGTALKLAEAILQNIPRKTHLFTEAPHGKIPPDALHVASLRTGAIPGTHTVSFDASADTITLTHTARSRAGFAEGAVIAAEWIIGRIGFFTMQDFLEDRRRNGLLRTS